MREKFPWYFYPTETEFEDIWTRGIITPDANVLLNLYRYQDATVASLLRIFKKCKDQLWLTQQAANEFLRHRVEVINSVPKKYDEAKNAIDDAKTSLMQCQEELYKLHLIPKDEIVSFITNTSKLIDDFKENIATLKTQHPDRNTEDQILNEVIELFNQNIGEGFSHSKLEEIYKEGKLRYQNKIPPGYKDNDKAEPDKYGDLIIWREILEKAKSDSKPIILITADIKEDWWERNSGKTIGPKYELLKEANQETGQIIWIYQFDKFIDYASKRFDITLEEESVNEVKDSLQGESSDNKKHIKFICDKCNKDILLKRAEGHICINWDDIVKAKKEEEEWQRKKLENDGFAELNVIGPPPSVALWKKYHYSCSSDDNCYSIDVTRIKNEKELIEWSAHLMEKSWFPLTNWSSFIWNLVQE